MVGINLDTLDNLIKKNNVYLNLLVNNSNKLISSMNELKNCYSGNSVEYLFLKPINEINNLGNIYKVVKSYSNTLSSVKISYQMQDQNLKMQINHMHRL